MTPLALLAAKVIIFLDDPTPTPTPTPLPAYEGDPNLVTPGVVGFTVIAVIALITVLLVLDMTRRIRRVRYRAEVREQLEAEAADRAGEVSPQRED